MWSTITKIPHAFLEADIPDNWPAGQVPPSQPRPVHAEFRRSRGEGLLPASRQAVAEDHADATAAQRAQAKSPA